LEWRFNYTNIPTNGMAQIQARLLRLTSSTNMNLTDVAGHFTTLSTTVGTGQPLDSVGDGIPDSWRSQFFPNQPTNNLTGTMTNGLSCATCDADGTGQDNLFKYLAGLDPTNPASIFVVNAVQSAQPGGFVVNWASVPGYIYQVLDSSSAGGPWQAVSSPSTAAVNQVSMTYTDTTANAVSTRFYRVQNLGS